MSHGAVTLLGGGVGTGDFLNVNNLGSYTFTSAQQNGFNPLGADKIVLAITFEGSGGLKLLNNATYNGQTLNPVITNTNGGQFTGIYYFDTDGTLAAGDLVLTASGTTGGVQGSLFALTGTLDGAPTGGSISQVDGLSTTVNAGAGSFVVGQLGTNGSSAPTIAGGSGLTMNFASGDGGLSSSGGTGYQLVASANTSLPIAFSTSQTVNQTLAAASFEAIPEPSATLLGGLGALLLLRRRRA